MIPSPQQLFSKYASSAAAADRIIRCLHARYEEPHRGYHDLDHLCDCFYLLNEYSYVVGDDTDAIQIALWYHDAIYEPRGGDNEERSVELARRELTRAGVNEELIQQVSELILSTKHGPNGPMCKNIHEMLLNDIDLWILASPQARFDQYEEGVWFEYRNVGWERFCEGRKRVLSWFLDRERIYLTDEFHTHYHEAARENITRALSKL